MRVAIVGGTGPFGRALAGRLHEAGVEVVIGSRDADRAEALAAELGLEGAANALAVRGVDLVVLATKADGALETARALRPDVGDTPVLSVASELTFTSDGVVPSPEATSLAERIQGELDGPVVAGLHSLAASTLGAPEAPHEDALVCGDDEAAKALALDLADAPHRRSCVRRRPTPERARTGGPDRGHREPQQAVQGARGDRDHRLAVSREVRVIALGGIPELEEGDDLGALLVAASQRAGGLEAGDVVVVAQKAVSKVEGRVVALEDVDPSERARELAQGDDPRRVEVILRESRELLRARGSLLITETRHGFVCASAGVDSSNAKGPGTVILLPIDPDASARRLRDDIREGTGVEVGVVVSDSFGRAWRQGTTDVALGVAGLAPLLDLRGQRDSVGYELQATQIAVADEIAGAAELVMGKTDGIPAVIVRGCRSPAKAAVRIS